MARRTRFASLVVLAASALTGTAGGQAATAPAAPPWDAPAVGSLAPDFQLPGATRFGLLKTPIRLLDFRGKTVVLAFFYQARTKG